MSLSTDQQKKIIEEESFRQQLRATYQQVPKKKTNWVKWFVFIGLGLIAIITVIIWNTTPTKEIVDTPKPDLVGSVTFDGRLFHVTNEETEDWTSCWVRLNQDYFYPADAPARKFTGIKAGATEDFSQSDFTKRDGTMFNAYIVKPTQIAFDCNGRFGFWQW